MRREFLTLKEAALISGLHRKTLQRLVRTGVIEGHKANYDGHIRWYVSAAALSAYTDPFRGYLLDKPGPKLYLRRAGDDEGEGKMRAIRGVRERSRIRRQQRRGG